MLLHWIKEVTEVYWSHLPAEGGVNDKNGCRSRTEVMEWEVEYIKTEGQKASREFWSSEGGIPEIFKKRSNILSPRFEGIDANLFFLFYAATDAASLPPIFFVEQSS